jgi:hypothetical protein
LDPHPLCHFAAVVACFASSSSRPVSRW